MELTEDEKKKLEEEALKKSQENKKVVSPELKEMLDGLKPDMQKEILDQISKEVEGKIDSRIEKVVRTLDKKYSKQEPGEEKPDEKASQVTLFKKDARLIALQQIEIVGKPESDEERNFLTTLLEPRLGTLNPEEYENDEYKAGTALAKSAVELFKKMEEVIVNRKLEQLRKAGQLIENTPPAGNPPKTTPSFKKGEEIAKARHGITASEQEAKRKQEG